MGFLNEINSVLASPEENENQNDRIKNECRKEFYQSVLEILQESIKESVSNGQYREIAEGKIIKGAIEMFYRNTDTRGKGGYRCVCYCLDRSGLKCAEKEIPVCVTPERNYDIKTDMHQEIALFQNGEDVTGFIQDLKNLKYEHMHMPYKIKRNIKQIIMKLKNLRILYIMAQNEL